MLLDKLFRASEKNSLTVMEPAWLRSKIRLVKYRTRLTQRCSNWNWNQNYPKQHQLWFTKVNDTWPNLPAVHQRHHCYRRLNNTMKLPLLKTQSQPDIQKLRDPQCYFFLQSGLCVFQCAFWQSRLQYQTLWQAVQCSSFWLFSAHIPRKAASAQYSWITCVERPLPSITGFWYRTQ